MKKISGSFWYIPLKLPDLQQKGLADGKELCSAMKKELPSLILLDIMLPGEADTAF